MNHDLAFASIARILDFCFNNNDLETYDSLYDSQILELNLLILLNNLILI